MVSVRSADFVITMISFFLAYVFVVTFVGCFRAWVTDKMGDDSAMEAGYFTLNPLPHMDLVGLVCLFLFHIGWGNFNMPLNPARIVAANPIVRWIKLCIAYFSDAIGHIVLATLAMATLLIMFGKSVIYLSAGMMLNGELSHMNFALNYPASSSMSISVALILIASIYLNVFLAGINFVFRGLELFMIYLIEKAPQYAKYNNIATIFLYAIIVSIFVTPQLRLGLVMLISHWGSAIASLFGAA